MVFITSSRLKSTMFCKTPWACPDQAPFNAIIHLWPPCKDIPGIGLSATHYWKRRQMEQLDTEFCHLPHLSRTLHFNEPHLQCVRRKVPSPSTSTWRLLGDTSSWWKVELEKRGEMGNDRLCWVKKERGDYRKRPFVEAATVKYMRCVHRCSLGHTCPSLDTSPPCGSGNNIYQRSTRRWSGKVTKVSPCRFVSARTWIQNVQCKYICSNTHTAVFAAVLSLVLSLESLLKAVAIISNLERV